ncbi:hypothetical protein [Sulfurimonas sp. HSL3-7]|uniref:HvfA family oxazolone/thioamide-modified RiPP metallophore n=1 Tax=Sulfonitrofixus jiaomeiensis TaxID=3131938 RepID=UPI0031F7EA86
MKKMSLLALFIGAALFIGLGTTSAWAQEGKCGTSKPVEGKCGAEKKAAKCGAEKKAEKCGAEKKAEKCGAEKTVEKVGKCGAGKCGK